MVEMIYNRLLSSNDKRKKISMALEMGHGKKPFDIIRF
jgi:hypothetical protein